MNGEYGVVDVEGVGEEGLDFKVLDESPEFGEKLPEVSGYVLAFGLELDKGVEVARESSKFVNGLDPGLEGALLLEKGRGLLGIVPEVGRRRGAVDFTQAVLGAFFVKDSS